MVQNKSILIKYKNKYKRRYAKLSMVLQAFLCLAHTEFLISFFNLSWV